MNNNNRKALYLPKIVIKLILSSPWKVKKLIHKILPKLIIVPFRNYKIYLDLNDEGVCCPIYYNGIYEEKLSRFYLANVRPGMTIVDIGANIGYYTCLFASLVGETGKIFAFEPDSNNFKLLEASIKINKFNNVILINKAVSDKNGKSNLYLDQNENQSDDFNASGGHSLVVTDYRNKFIEVETITLDSYFQKEDTKNTKIDFIKMDIEGAEPLALKGMRNIIINNPSLKLISEILPYALKASGTTAQVYLTNLSNIGFKFYLFEEAGIIKHITLIEAIREANKDTGTKFPHFDLLCVR